MSKIRNIVNFYKANKLGYLISCGITIPSIVIVLFTQGNLTITNWLLSCLTSFAFIFIMMSFIGVLIK